MEHVSETGHSNQPVTEGDDVAAEWELLRTRQCQHCGGAHARACPRVKRLEWHPNGELAAVEFWPEGAWSTDGVLWPEDIPVT